MKLRAGTADWVTAFLKITLVHGGKCSCQLCKRRVTKKILVNCRPPNPTFVQDYSDIIIQIRISGQLIYLYKYIPEEKSVWLL